MAVYLATFLPTPISSAQNLDNCIEILVSELETVMPVGGPLSSLHVIKGKNHTEGRQEFIVDIDIQTGSYVI